MVGRMALFGLAGAFLLPAAGPGAARAAEPESGAVAVELKMEPEGGAAFRYRPRRLALAARRPAGVRKEPPYRGTPAYGSLAFGFAPRTEVYFVLDRPKNGDPLLYVDGNADGDLTNDAPARWTRRDYNLGQGKTRSVFSATVAAVARYERGVRSEPLSLGVDYRVQKPENPEYVSSLYTFRRYARAGTLKLGEKEFGLRLIDERTGARFHQLEHADGEGPNVSLYVDRDADGRFDDRYERFDAAKPFNLGGVTYQVASIDPAGACLTLKPAAVQVAEIPVPPALSTGGMALSFGVKDTAGKEIEFPSSFAGKRVLLTFWATWSGASRAEIERQVEAYRRHQKQGFEVLGICLDHPNQGARIRKFLADFKVAWPQIYDGLATEGPVARLYGISRRGLPVAYLVDGATGRILAEGRALRGAELERTLARLLPRSGV